MKKARKELNEYLEQCLIKYVCDKQTERDIIKYCYKTYGISFFRTQTILRLDASTVELKDAEIFCVLSAIKEINKKANINLADYFSDIEIENYSKVSFGQNAAVKFPLVIDCIKVTDNQWIGVIKVSTLLKWRNQFLRYNKDIQRRLQLVMRNNLTYERITMKSKSVNDMVKAFTSGEFIPNTITLNIDDTETNFYYDDDAKHLVIESVDHMDITDGYHRLVALSKVLETNPFFDFTMELRITNFTDTIASHFIWQEEQRNIMPKRDIKSFNMDDFSNRIVRRIDSNVNCNFSGDIKRGGKVDFSSFAEMVDYLYLNNITEEAKRTAIVDISKDLVECINIISDTDSSLIGNHISIMDIRIMVFVCHKFYKKDKADLFKMFDLLRKQKYTDKEKANLSNGTPKRTVRILDDHLKGEGWQ